MKKILAIMLVLILVISAIFVIDYYKEEVDEEDQLDGFDIEGEKITIEYNFSDPKIEEHGDYVVAYVEEADFNDIHDGWPVIPVKTKTFSFPLGTRIIDVVYEYSEPKEITLTKKISYGTCSAKTAENKSVYKSSESFPSDFVSYKTNGGLSSDGEHTTFLTVRVNPFTYRPADDSIDFVDNVKINIFYEEPINTLFEENNEFDLLIITVSDFKKNLNKLVTHKNKIGVRTKLVTLNEIKDTMGRDTQEKMKYYIKESIESCGIKYVLLVGGMKGQSTKWNLPVRYSHLLISEGKQEIPEPEFISDLYFADIYDGEGNFSSWDSNNNDIFAEREGAVEIDEMDLYPDVYLGRLACRDKRDVRLVVDKIINYESKKAADSWFKRIILVSGDHWKDPEQISEGALIMDKAAEIMSGFNAVKLIASEKNTLLIRHINQAINKGAGFAYFSGHGAPTSWGIKYPPDASGWAPQITRLGLITALYSTNSMNFLRNKNKYPVTIVGGCNNGQFDISIGKSLKSGKLKLSNSKCWAWKLTSKKNGGAIATIANTGLGTHAMSDADKNNVNDYLEVLDGWMELRFLELFNREKVNVLGKLHSTAMKEYLDTFICSNDEMDAKMVQQWQLFGDPSLRVGGC